MDAFIAIPLPVIDDQIDINGNPVSYDNFDLYDWA